jgi:hypothetical protein
MPFPHDPAAEAYTIYGVQKGTSQVVSFCKIRGLGRNFFGEKTKIMGFKTGQKIEEKQILPSL